jgi:AcrR family transcriptional regulator
MTKNVERREQTLKSLEAALTRLVNGNPNRVRPGYRISINAVCDEADVSRQTFYSRYRSFEAIIKAAASRVGKPSVSRSRRRELEVRAENEALKMQVQSLLSQNATLLHRATTAEKQLEIAAGRGGLTLLSNTFAGRTEAGAGKPKSEPRGLI